MTTIFLVRHGEVEGNMGPRRTFAGARDLELNATGRAQARAVAARLAGERVDALYSSPLRRAHATATAIATSHDLSVRLAPELREVSYGQWEGLGALEIERDFLEAWRARVADPWNVAPPGGESYSALWERLAPFWARVLEEHEGERLVLVAHSGPLRVLLCALIEAPFANARSISIGNASLTKVGVATREETRRAKLPLAPLVIEYVNDTSHLEALADCS